MGVSPKAPGPGMYSNVPFGEYAAWPWVNNSKLSVLKDKTPAHLLAYKNGAETKALRDGHRIHSAVLTPFLFPTEFVQGEVCSGGVKKPCEHPGKVRWEGRWFCGTHKKQVEGWEGDPFDDIEIVTPEEFSLCMNVSDAVRKNAAAADLLNGAVTERCLVWHDPTTKLRCKARVDIDNERLLKLGDLKTTDDASPSGFSRSIGKYGYHRQMTFYKAGYEALGHRRDDGVEIIAAEKKYPFGVAVYRLSDEATELGAEQLMDLMALYKKCKEDDHWPGYPQTVQSINLMPWEYTRVD
jgi:PDDEXK-like domain of unknown function (DUF3799)